MVSFRCGPVKGAVYGSRRKFLCIMCIFLNFLRKKVRNQPCLLLYAFAVISAGYIEPATCVSVANHQPIGIQIPHTVDIVPLMFPNSIEMDRVLLIWQRILLFYIPCVRFNIGILRRPLSVEFGKLLVPCKKFIPVYFALFRLKAARYVPSEPIDSFSGTGGWRRSRIKRNWDIIPSN